MRVAGARNSRQHTGSFSEAAQRERESQDVDIYSLDIGDLRLWASIAGSCLFQLVQ